MLKYLHEITARSDLQYWDRTERNLGIVTETEQEHIRDARIAVLGTGGLGGPLALNLVYAGCQHLILADHDVVDISNLNRQPFTTADLGRPKTEVLQERLTAIDPQVHIEIYDRVRQENVDNLIHFADIVVLTLDDPLASILVARECVRLHVPMVEAWATPFIFSWWFTDQSISYEACYNLTTENISVTNLEASPEYQHTIRHAFIAKLASLPNIIPYYNRDPQRFDQMMAGKIGFRSFAPWVWMTGSYLAFDVIFAGILARKPKILAPRIRAFDLFTQKIVDVGLDKEEGKI